MGVATTCPAAGVASHEAAREGKRVLVLENDRLRVEVVPELGGRVASFVDKRLEQEYVSLGMKGAGGWGDFNFGSFNLASDGDVFKTAPYGSRVLQGDGWRAIEVSRTYDNLRVTRTMALRQGGRDLEIRIRGEALGKPRRVRLRWHPCVLIHGAKGKDQFTIVPGPGPRVRKSHAAYWQDSWMRPELGCLATIDAGRRRGLWTTFERDKVDWVLCWGLSRRGAESGATAELMGRAYLAQPGRPLDVRITYTPFGPDDAWDRLPAGAMQDAAEIRGARRFAGMVRANLSALARYDSWTGFRKMRYRLPDRPVMAPWGFGDVMLLDPGSQEIPLKGRFHAAVLGSVQAALPLEFRLCVRGAHDKVVKAELTKRVTAKPGTDVDQVLELPLTRLEDGEYLFQGELRAGQGKEAALLHREVKRGRLNAQHVKRMQEDIAKRGDPPIRPFVLALSKRTGRMTPKGEAVVDIGVEEAGGLSRQGCPVRAALSLPSGAFQGKPVVRLADASGRAVPVQVDVATVWPDQSAKWLHVGFPATVAANGSSFYTATVSKAAGPVPDDRVARETPKSVMIRAGDLTMDIARDRPGLPVRIRYRGRDALLPFQPGDLWWEQPGVTCSFAADSAEIERNGPLTATVRLAGTYRDDKGRARAQGCVRFEAHKDRSTVVLKHTVTFLGNPYDDALRSYGIRLRFGPGRFRSVTAAAQPADLTGSRLDLSQATPDRLMGRSGSGRVVGRRALGAFLWSGPGEHRLGAYVRDFWESCPEAAVADAASGVLTVSHWPGEAGVQDFLPPEDRYTSCSSGVGACATGLSRTHEIVLDFAPEGTAADLAKAHDEPVIAVAAPRWLETTRALGELAAFNATELPEVESYIRGVFLNIERHRELFSWYGEWIYGAHGYAWWPWVAKWADDGRMAWMLNEDYACTSVWYLFARSGDRLYLNDAVPNARNMRDVASIEASPAWPEYVGGSRRHHYTLWLGEGSTQFSMLDQFVSDWIFTGDRRSWDAAKRQADFCIYARTGAWRALSNPLSSLSRIYVETGEPRYKQKADWLAKTFGGDPKHKLWMGTGNGYFTYGSSMIRWYSLLSADAEKRWIEGTRQGSGELRWKSGYGKGGTYSCLADLGSIWRKTGEAPLARAAHEAAQRMLTMFDKSNDPRFRWMENRYSLYQHVHSRRALFMAQAKHAIVAGSRLPPAPQPKK